MAVQLSSVADIQDEIVEEFQLFDDWAERYKYIIEVGRKMPVIDEQYKVPENKVLGCQSQVWLHAESRDGRIYYSADSDAAIVRGLIALALRIYSGRTPDEILEAPADFVEKVGLNENLSMTRANGLRSVIKQIKFYALGYKALLSQA